MSALYQSFKQENGSLRGYIEHLCYRFWKYPIPRRIQRVYDKACLYRKLLPYIFAVYLEELVILFTEGFDVFVFIIQLGVIGRTIVCLTKAVELRASWTLEVL